MRLLAYLAVALALTGPAWLAPAARVVGRPEGEFRDHVWVSWMITERVWTDHALPIHFPLASFPEGIGLYPLDPLNQAAITLLTPLLGHLPAFLLVGTALLALAGHGADRLAVACGAGPAGALAAGLVSQLGPPLLGVHADAQTEGMGAGWAPWLVATLVEDAPWDRARALRAGGLAAALVLSAPYQAHALSLVAVPLLGILLWRRRLPLVRLVQAGLVALPALLVAAGGLWLGESHAHGQLTARARDLGDWPPRTALRGVEVPPVLPQVSATSPVVVRSWPREARYMPPTTGPRRWAGWVLPLVTAGLLLRAGPGRRLALVSAVYASLALGSAREWDALSLGDGRRVPLPFDLWYRHYPGGHLAWKPAQYAVPAWSFAAAGVGTLPGPWSLVAGGAVVAEAWLRGPTPPPLPVMEVPPVPVFDDLRDAAPGGVVEFPGRARGPFGPETLPFDSLLFQRQHRHPIGESFGRGENRPYLALMDALATTVGWPGPVGPPLPEAWAHATARGFRHLVVHGSMFRPEEASRLRAAIQPLAAGSPRTYPDGVWWYAMEPR